MELFRSEPILDPLWITKGQEGLDSEYYMYVLLAANKKYRERLEISDFTSVPEILFHLLNLNSLSIEGKIFDFKLSAISNDPKLKEIRSHLRQMYQIPQELLDIFKNSNHILISVLIDHLEEMIDFMEGCHQYHMNKKIHLEKEIFIVVNQEKGEDYDIWKMRFDRRIRENFKIEKITQVKIDGKDYTSLAEVVKDLGDPRLSGLDSEKNVCFLVTEERLDDGTLIGSAANLFILNRALINKGSEFHPHIIQDLRNLIEEEKMLPFTIGEWI